MSAVVLLHNFPLQKPQPKHWHQQYQGHQDSLDLPGVHKHRVQTLCLPGLSKRVLPVPCVFCCTSYTCWSPQLLTTCQPDVSVRSVCALLRCSHREPLPMLKGRAFQCTIILQRNEIMKPTPWSIRHGTLSAVRSPVLLRVSHFFRSRSNLLIWWMLLIQDGSSSKHAGFPRIPWGAPPKFPNLKESLKSQFVSSVFKIKAEKRPARAQAVISAPVRWVLFLMDHCLRISYVLTDSSFNSFIKKKSKSTCVKPFF